MAKLAPHHHSGRVLEHRHTSYPGLSFLLMVVGVMLMLISSSVSANTPISQAENPQSGSIGLTGVIPAPAPTTGATILNPRNGARTSAIPITVSGICPSGLLVSIYKNDVFGGSTLCSQSGAFDMQADLFDGQNNIVAKVQDSLGQSGPDSAAVNIFYAAPSLDLPNSSAAFGRQLFLLANTPTLGTLPGVPLTWQVTIVGGTPPYALSWDWGDGKTDLVSRPSEGQVSTAHTYDRPGNYRVIAKVTDGTGNNAFLQLVTVVSGPVTAAATTGGKGGFNAGTLIAVWPLYLLACFFVAAFWLGERRELIKLRRQYHLSV